MAILAVIAGAQGWEDIENYCSPKAHKTLNAGSVAINPGLKMS